MLIIIIILCVVVPLALYAVADWLGLSEAAGTNAALAQIASTPEGIINFLLVMAGAIIVCLIAQFILAPLLSIILMHNGKTSDEMKIEGLKKWDE